MKGRDIPYSTEELTWIEERREWPRAVMHRLFVMLFERRDVSLTNLNALCKRKGWLTGRTGCFEKGQTPVNKGRPCAPGTGGRHPNARRTQFTKGQRRGVAVELYQPIGTERISKDGYRERKVNDDLPLQARWRRVHLLEWEAVNGPLPAGCCLKCLDGDKTNTDPANWEPVERGVLARLNGGRHKKRMAYDDAAPELKPTLMAMAKVEHQASRLKRKAAA